MGHNVAFSAFVGHLGSPEVIVYDRKASGTVTEPGTEINEPACASSVAPFLDPLCCYVLCLPVVELSSESSRSFGEADRGHAIAVGRA